MNNTRFGLLIWGIIALILVFAVVVSAGGFEGILGGITSANVTTKDLALKSGVKETLASMETKKETTCIEWVDTCLEYEKCLKFDEKTQTCLEWDTKTKCLKTEKICVSYGEVDVPVGITEVTIIPKGNNCYDVISEPMLHRYNTCISDKESIENYVKKDLEMIAKHIEIEKTKSVVVDENIIQITIK